MPDHRQSLFRLTVDVFQFERQTVAVNRLE